MSLVSFRLAIKHFGLVVDILSPQDQHRGDNIQDHNQDAVYGLDEGGTL